MQQKVFDQFLESIEKCENLLLSSEERGIGKTTTLNELGLTLQALGYIVYILTPYQKPEYYAHRFIYNNMYLNRGLSLHKAVVIADESKYETMNELLEYCKYHGIPVVGYVNYKSDRYCTVSESLKDSLQQMNDTRAGKIPKKTWDGFKEELDSEDNVPAFKLEYECQWVGGVDLATESDKTIICQNGSIIECIGNEKDVVRSKYKSQDID